MPPQASSLPELIRACQEESKSRNQLKPADSACWTLLCSAVDDDNQQAWRAVREQYRKLIIMWGQSYQSPLEADELVNEVFTRFLHALRGQKVSQKFDNLPRVLSYWRQCVLSVAKDAQATHNKQHALHTQLKGRKLAHTSQPHRYFEDGVLDRLMYDDCYELIQHYLKDDEERLVFELSVVYDFKPSEIVAQEPALFPEREKVYRVKERCFDRLRHNDMILQLCKSLPRSSPK